MNKDGREKLDVVSFGSYPIKPAWHGGQRRVAAIANVYKAAGIRSSYVPIFPTVYYEDKSDGFAIAFDARALSFIVEDGRLQDVDLHRLGQHDTEVLKRVQCYLADTRPAILQFEHPWTYPIVRRAVSDMPGYAPKIIYSSQNVEGEMFDQPEAASRAEALERSLIQVADMTIAVTAVDAEKFRSVGARHVVVFGNGYNLEAPSEAAISKWSKELANSACVLFVGSGHPPNAAGFLNMLGPIPGCVMPGTKILVIGDVSHLIANSRIYNVYRALFDQTIRFLGRVTDDDLRALLLMTKAVLLPITSGGGSNLKTAEALLSGKPVIGTQMSFRGFEEFSHLSGVYLTNDPPKFKAIVRDALLGDLVSNRTISEVKSLTWDHRLSKLGAAVRTLLA